MIFCSIDIRNLWSEDWANIFPWLMKLKWIKWEEKVIGWESELSVCWGKKGGLIDSAKKWIKWSKKWVNTISELFWKLNF
jgi:hypothetical protein